MAQALQLTRGLLFLLGPPTLLSDQIVPLKIEINNSDSENGGGH